MLRTIVVLVVLKRVVLIIIRMLVILIISLGGGSCMHNTLLFSVILVSDRSFHHLCNSMKIPDFSQCDTMQKSDNNDHD